MPASEDYTPLDTLKRYLSAPRRMVGEGLSSLATLPQRAFQASEQMRTEGPYDPGPAIEAAMLPMGTGAIAGAPVRAGETALGAGPIRGYHSSPHDFPAEPGFPLGRFDLSKIGTGEGAQVYGHGAYIAENPAVSGQGGQYWNSFQRRFSGPEYQASERLRGAGFDREKAIENVNDRINRAINSGDTNKQFMDEQIKTLQLLESGKPVGPRTYEVNINADPAHMLNWDKPLTQQPQALRELSASHPELRKYFEQAPEARGDVAYNQGLGGRQKASEALREAGIPGIRYLDQGSRNAQPILKTDAKGNVISSHYPPPSSNYVVFNPSIIDIVKKYGLAGLAAPPAIAGAMNQERQP